MKILSESIADYIDLNYDISDIKDVNELDNVNELVINCLNYSLEDCKFYPNELSFFKKLEKCTFVNFYITDEIVDNLNKINLKKLVLNNCNSEINIRLVVDSLYMENSIINLNNVNTNNLTILDCGDIDLNFLINSNLKNLRLLNSNLLNSNLLKKMDGCNIEIIGCTLDDEEVKNLKNVKYSSERFEKII